MGLESFYPVLAVDDVAAGQRFYVEHLDFEITFENEWYVSLIHREQRAYQLAFVARTHESVPAPFRRPAAGVLLNFEVADAASEYRRLQSAGVPTVQPLRDDPTGQRHFIAVDPNGVLLDVVQMIPPAPECATSYVRQGDTDSTAP